LYCQGAHHDAPILSSSQPTGAFLGTAVAPDLFLLLLRPVIAIVKRELLKGQNVAKRKEAQVQQSRSWLVVLNAVDSQVRLVAVVEKATEVAAIGGVHSHPWNGSPIAELLVWLSKKEHDSSKRRPYLCDSNVIFTSKVEIKKEREFLLVVDETPPFPLHIVDELANVLNHELACWDVLQSTHAPTRVHSAKQLYTHCITISDLRHSQTAVVTAALRAPVKQTYS
jgi:hypothetical protein